MVSSIKIERSEIWLAFSAMSVFAELSPLLRVAMVRCEACSEELRLDMFSEFTRDEKNSVLISSHIVSDLEKICDYIAFIHRGRLMLCEEKDVLLEEYGIVNCRPEELGRIPEGAVIGRRESAYGVRAIVRRCAALGMQISPVTLEELFVFMVKEA